MSRRIRRLTTPEILLCPSRWAISERLNGLARSSFSRADSSRDSSRDSAPDSAPDSARECGKAAGRLLLLLRCQACDGREGFAEFEVVHLDAVIEVEFEAGLGQGEQRVAFVVFAFAQRLL